MFQATHLVGFGAARSVYYANAVRFDGSNDYLTRGATMSGAADSKVGIMYLSIKWTGGNSAVQRIIQDNSSGTKIFITKDTNDKFTITLENSSDQTGWNFISNTSITTSSGWVNILASWTLGSTTANFYIDDSQDTGSTNTVTDRTIDWTNGEFGFGAAPNGTAPINAEVALVYLNIAEYLDITSASNRRKFFDANGKPVDLGSDGSNPTGSQPILYFAKRSGESASDFATNKGSGGGFTITGTLTDAASSPSD